MTELSAILDVLRQPDADTVLPNLTTVVDAVGADRVHGFLEAVEKVDNCANPIWVRGRSIRVDQATGEILGEYSSTQEKFGITPLPCKNRRAGKCPACAWVYAGDTFQVIRAGIIGGRGVPEHVADNPMVFATLTAPSFGKVHTQGPAGACHPRTRGPARCAHGVPRICPRRHDDDDEPLGQPLCLDCYDYASAVVWQWWAPKLWQRFTIALNRAIAADLGVAATRLGEVARLEYAKVTEPQRRGSAHFHALMRLDGPKTDEGYAPAPRSLDAKRFAHLVTDAARNIRLTAPGVDREDPDRVLAFGRQCDAHPVSARRRDCVEGEITPEKVAAYLAKYATKSASEVWNEHTPHADRFQATIRSLAARAAAADSDPADYSRLSSRVADAGYRGHFSTRSRGYSITLGAVDYARRRVAHLIARGVPKESLDLAALDAQLLADDDTETVIGQWEFVGTGWASSTEKDLALGAAARAREWARADAADRKTNQQGEEEHGSARSDDLKRGRETAASV